jgi:hypothetical protein
MRTRDLLAFIIERHNIYRRRQRGDAKPWTDDSILQQYRFCNIYRELDTVTRWISDNWRTPNLADPDVWFAMVVARVVNWPETLSEVGYPVPWNPTHFVRVLEDRAQRREKVYTGAYMIHADRKFNGSKAAYLAAEVLGPLWRDRLKLRQIRRGTLASAHRALMSYRDMGSFTAAQVIADLKYVEPLRSASDWWTWAGSGPGSRRGLNRVLGRPKDTPWDESDWLHRLQILHREISPGIETANMPTLHAQDLQNSLCEWHKYESVRLGEGKPRSKYPGNAE